MLYLGYNSNKNNIALLPHTCIMVSITVRCQNCNGTVKMDSDNAYAICSACGNKVSGPVLMQSDVGSADFVTECKKLAAKYDGLLKECVIQCAESFEKDRFEKGLSLEEEEMKEISKLWNPDKNKVEAYIAERRASIRSESKNQFDSAVETVRNFDEWRVRIPGDAVLLFALALRDADNRKKYVMDFSYEVPAIMANAFAKACDPSVSNGTSAYKNTWNGYVSMLSAISGTLPDNKILSNALADGTRDKLTFVLNNILRNTKPWAEKKADYLELLGKASAACAPFQALEPEHRRVFAGIHKVSEPPKKGLFEKDTPERRDIAEFRAHIEKIADEI